MTTTAKKPKISDAHAARHALWLRGVIFEQFCSAHPHQLRMAEAIRSSTAQRFVVNCSRRFGKSTAACILALEKAYQQPNAQIKFAAPNQKQARKIIQPILKWLLGKCPKELRPKFNNHEGVWRFHNGSEIHIAGSEMGQIDNLRGTACDLALIDEAGFMDDLEYVIESVIGPQLLGRPGAKIVILSTPPKSPDHPFVTRYMQTAIAKGAYAKFTIYDNPRISPEEIEELLKEVGGETSTAWRREYLAEIVTESTNAVFPEATEAALKDITYDAKLPHFYNPITVADIGWVDFTGVLFGYYDFRDAKIVIQDEIMISHTNSDELVRMITAKERELWGDRRDIARWVDAPRIVQEDLGAIHGFQCGLATKSDLEAGVNRVRMLLGNRGVIIAPRCRNLISQLRFATWDSKRTKFARTSGHHYDLAAAIIYLTRHLDTTSNPYPATWGYDLFNDVNYPREHANSLAKVLRAMFPIKRDPG